MLAPQQIIASQMTFPKKLCWLDAFILPSVHVKHNFLYAFVIVHSFTNSVCHGFSYCI